MALLHNAILLVQQGLRGLQARGELAHWHCASPTNLESLSYYKLVDRVQPRGNRTVSALAQNDWLSFRH